MNFLSYLLEILNFSRPSRECLENADLKSFSYKTILVSEGGEFV